MLLKHVQIAYLSTNENPNTPLSREENTHTHTHTHGCGVRNTLYMMTRNVGKDMVPFCLLYPV
jgi:hypothetical protein